MDTQLGKNLLDPRENNLFPCFQANWYLKKYRVNGFDLEYRYNVRESYPPEFNEELKDEIRERDRYQCQQCGKSTKRNKQRLDVHHINQDKEDLSWANLTSLCRKCHEKIHGSFC